MTDRPTDVPPVPDVRSVNIDPTAVPSGTDDPTAAPAVTDDPTVAPSVTDGPAVAPAVTDLPVVADGRTVVLTVTESPTVTLSVPEGPTAVLTVTDRPTVVQPVTHGRTDDSPTTLMAAVPELTPVFVDPSGRRRRRLRRFAYGVGLVGLAYTGMVGVSFAGGPVSPETVLPFVETTQPPWQPPPAAPVTPVTPATQAPTPTAGKPSTGARGGSAPRSTSTRSARPPAAVTGTPRPTRSPAAPPTTTTPSTTAPPSTAPPTTDPPPVIDPPPLGPEPAP